MQGGGGEGVNLFIGKCLETSLFKNGLKWTNIHTLFTIAMNYNKNNGGLRAGLMQV